MYEEFLGKKILGVRRDGDNVILETPLGEPDIILEPYGDCCSQTWIESIDLMSPLYDAIIQKIEDIDMPHKGDIPTLEHPMVECVKYYGLRITTNKGVSVIDYRNDSNGYYGGELTIRFQPKSTPNPRKKNKHELTDY